MAATLQLIAKRGYEEVSIDDIAVATGNTKGAVYHYFDSKKALYRESLGFLADRLTSLSVQETGSPEDSGELQSRLLGQILMAGTRNPLIADLTAPDLYYLFFDGIRRFPEIKKTFQEQNRRFLQESALQLDGLLPSTDTSEDRALHLLLLLEGLTLIQTMTDGFVTEEKLSALLDRFFG